MKLTLREFTILAESMLTQIHETLDDIVQAESNGKNPLFTTGYVIREQNDLYQKLRDNLLKKAIKDPNVAYYDQRFERIKTEY